MRVSVAGRELHKAQPVAMWIEAHRFGVDRDHGAEIEAIGQIMPMLMDRGVRHELRTAHRMLVPRKCTRNPANL
jgi:hypothetical protein